MHQQPALDMDEVAQPAASDPVGGNLNDLSPDGDADVHQQHLGLASPDLEDARRALRFAATQRIKKWKGDGGGGGGSGTAASPNGAQRSTQKPQTQKERDRVHNDQLEATRRERRLRDKDIHAKMTAAASQPHNPKPVIRGPSPTLSARIERLTQPTQAAIHRKRAVYEGTNGAVSSSRPDLASMSSNTKPGLQQHRTASASRRSGPSFGGSRSSLAPSSVNTSLEFLHSAHGTPIIPVRKAKGTLTLATSDAPYEGCADDAPIEQEMALLEARMRFLADKKQINEAERLALEKARIEALGQFAAATSAPQAVFEGGIVHDPTSGRRYQRLFSFRLHDVNTSRASISPSSTHQTLALTHHHSQPPPSRTASTIAGGVDHVPLGAHGRSSSMQASARHAESPTDQDDPRVVRRESRQQAGSPTNGSFGHDGVDGAASDGDAVIGGSPTSRWVIDSARRRSRQDSIGDSDEPAFTATQQTVGTDDDEEAPFSAAPHRPSQNHLDADVLAAAPLWMASGDHRRDASPVLNTPSEGMMRHGSRDTLNNAANRSTGGGSHHAAPAVPATPDYYSLPSAVPPSPLLKPGSPGGGSSNASPQSRAGRRSLVGFTDVSGSLVQSPPHRGSNDVDDSPTRRTMHLPPPASLGDYAYDTHGRLQQQRSPEGPRTQAAPASLPNSRRSMDFLEPERSFYARGRESSGVLGCSESEARLLTAAASQDADLTQHEIDLVAQLVIPSEVEASFQLMDDTQKRQLVRRYSTMHIKKMKSNLGPRQ
jgi:hypothetical protein